MQALDHNLIGIATTNAVRVAAPTYGSQIMLGSNPFAYAVPAGDEPPFVLDFATTTNPRETLDGALLPLGGLGVEGGGHKGYGLGLLADILSGVFSGGRFGRDLPLPGDAPLPGAISHWFAAFRVDGFRDIDEFKRDMDIELRNFKDSAKAPGQDRIYVAGEIEHEMTLEHRKHGVPIRAGVWDGLAALGAELGVPLELALVPAGDSL
jgi:LDH2 family malate/lactate/ureidoglycolate dehydrogenase